MSKDSPLKTAEFMKHNNDYNLLNFKHIKLCLGVIVAETDPQLIRNALPDYTQAVLKFCY